MPANDLRKEFFREIIQQAGKLRDSLKTATALSTYFTEDERTRFYGCLELINIVFKRVIAANREWRMPNG